jgi:hypothetical protein
MQYVLVYIQQNDWKQGKKTERGYEAYHKQSTYMKAKYDDYTLDISEASKFDNLNEAYKKVESKDITWDLLDWYYVVEEAPIEVCPDCERENCMPCEACADCYCEGDCNECPNCGMTECVDCESCGDCACDGSCGCSLCGDYDCEGDCEEEEETELDDGEE